MYNYKISEYDLADLMLYQMKKNKKTKNLLDICAIIFSISIVTVLMFIIKTALPEFNIISLCSGEIILSFILITRIFKNYRRILAKVFRRDVGKNSEKYDITLTIQGRRLMIYNRDSEEAFNINEIKVEQDKDASYLILKNKIIIVPNKIFKDTQEKNDFFLKL